MRVSASQTGLELSDDDAFVELCYRTFLGRAADPGGKAGFLDALRVGMKRLDLIHSMVSSPEYHGVLTRHLASQAEAAQLCENEAERIRTEITVGRSRAAARVEAIRYGSPVAMETAAGEHQRLPWFIALNEDAWHFEDYARMAKAAVESAHRYAPSLRPHLLYDGAPNALTAWMEGRGVPVIPCRSSLYADLAGYAERAHDENILHVGAGTFMRLELPALFAAGVIRDERILYTDCDVLFLDDVSELASTAITGPLAVGPEENPADYVHVNVGVIMMNLPELWVRDEEFKTYCRTHLESLILTSWDQGAYQVFYGGQWTQLDMVYNWKPYWEADYSRAKIIHFHGPKPTQLDLVERQQHPEHIQRLARGAYFELAAIWEEFDRLGEAVSPRA